VDFIIGDFKSFFNQNFVARFVFLRLGKFFGEALIFN
jgi:hypothetical protein